MDQARATSGKVNGILRREGIYTSQLTELLRKFSGNSKDVPGRLKGSNYLGSAGGISCLSVENARLREEFRQVKLVIGKKKGASLMSQPLGEDGFLLSSCC